MLVEGCVECITDRIVEGWIYIDGLTFSRAIEVEILASEYLIGKHPQNNPTLTLLRFSERTYWLQATDREIMVSILFSQLNTGVCLGVRF